MSLDIRLLDLGDIEAERSYVVLGREPGGTVRVPTFGHLILGADKPVLVDCGYRHADMLDRLGMIGHRSPDQELAAQLATHDVELGDIGTVINTHLHLDHAGQNDRFPMSTTVVVNRREMESAACGLEGAIYAPEDFKHMIDRLHGLRALRLLDLELTGPQEILPGITCVAANAHTGGSMMVLVETDGGTACICGDIVYDVQDQLVEPLLQTAVGEPAPVANSPIARRNEIAAIKRALGSGPFLLPMHDRPAVVKHGMVVGRLTDRVPQ